MASQKKKIVLIGCDRAGKTTIGNAILGKTYFKPSWLSNKTIVKGKTNKQQKKIQVYRVPGWTGDLKIQRQGQNKVRQQIVHCMKKNPHVIIWVMSTTKPMTDETVKTLEVLLTSEFWTYTVVVVTVDSRETNPSEAMDTYMSSNGLRDIGKKCQRIIAFCTSDPATDSKELLEVVDNLLEKCSSPFEMPTLSAVTLMRFSKKQHHTLESEDEIDTKEMYEQNFKQDLIFVLESLNSREFKKFTSFIEDVAKDDRIPQGELEGKQPMEVVDLMMKNWPDCRCVTYTRDILKMIRRNDMEKYLRVYLQNVGEKW